MMILLLGLIGTAFAQGGTVQLVNGGFDSDQCDSPLTDPNDSGDVDTFCKSITCDSTLTDLGLTCTAGDCMVTYEATLNTDDALNALCCNDAVTGLDETCTDSGSGSTFTKMTLTGCDGQSCVAPAPTPDPTLDPTLPPTADPTPAKTDSPTAEPTADPTADEKTCSELAKEECEKDENCVFEDDTCSDKEPEVKCEDHQDKETCNADANCTFDEEAETCGDKPKPEPEDESSATAYSMIVAVFVASYNLL